MFKKLVVALDGTPQSNVALPFARMLALACDSRLTLVRVIDPAAVTTDERQEQPARILEQLKRIADELRASALQVDVRVCTGEPVAEILGVAKVERADALIGVTHAGVLERLVDTSTIRRLVARTELPVFVLRPGGRRVTHIRRLLAAVDGSPGGAEALYEAVLLARSTGAALVLSRVIAPPEHFGFDPLLARTLGARPHPDSQAQALAIAEEYVNTLAHRLRAHGVDATARVMVGNPAERIIAAAGQVDADLIVMSTHAYLAPVRTLLGSTANEVVQAAGRPVLLICRAHRVGHKVDDATVHEPASVGQS
jgi:nucleotide-binding universal stress UspA family protein